ncbi:MAG: hypothetical protein ACK4X1_15430, partial [Terricaulis sp.]
MWGAAERGAWLTVKIGDSYELLGLSFPRNLWHSRQLAPHVSAATAAAAHAACAAATTANATCAPAGDASGAAPCNTARAAPAPA